MDASKAGARHISHVATGPEEAGGYWRPGVVLADLPDDDVAIVEEVFAPVLTVQPATDVTHALELANSVPQALAGSVWGRDTSVVLAVANGLDCGEVWINCHLEQTPELPHGGRRHSGHGTDLSVLALAEYQRPKCITAAVDL
jgi:acyl-CoA reductase-like NAD-dependent aldehyde dehydrogenase